MTQTPSIDKYRYHGLDSGIGAPPKVNLPTDRLQQELPYFVRSIPNHLEETSSPGDRLREFIQGFGFDPDNLTDHQARQLADAYAGQEFTFYTPDKLRNVASLAKSHKKYFAEYDDQEDQLRQFVIAHGFDPDNLTLDQAAKLADLYGKTEYLYYGPDMLRRMVQSKSWFYQKIQKDRDYSSTQFDISDADADVVSKLKMMSKKIKDEDLTPEGKEDDFHITVKYGLSTQNPDDVASVVKDFGPVTVILGETSLFYHPTEEEEEEVSFEVVKVDVESEDLVKLNNLLKSTLENEDKYPEYHPHITLAYVKDGAGEKYVKMTDVQGMQLTFHELAFSDNKGEKTKVDLMKREVKKIPSRLNGIVRKDVRLTSWFLKPVASENDEIKTVAVDLDGTICEYNGWKGEDQFGPVRGGAREAMHKIKDKGWRIIIFTVRGNVKNVAEFLQTNDIPYDYINENPDQPKGSSGKVVADIYIDDRAINAKRSWDHILQDVMNFHWQEKMGPGRFTFDPGYTFHSLLLEVPDVRQLDNFSCGSMCAMSVGKYFGVGPDTREEWIQTLHTDVEDSTRPTAIVDYLKSLGLEVEERQNMTIADLEDYWEKKMPVIVPIREYGIPDKKASFDYGHFVTVIGTYFGYVFVQDPTIDNLLDGEDSAAAPGRMMIQVRDFLNIWHDKDADGNEYYRYGIAVGPASGLDKITKSYFER